MTGIDPRQRLAAAVRNELAAARNRPGAQGPPGTGKAPAASHQPSAALQGTLAQRIAVIARDDPERKQKAFRVFLETALLQELGSGLVHDPSFPLMVEAVQLRMLGDADLAGAAEDLAAYLLEPAANAPR